ncbi:MAG: hypothetical protein V7K53_31595 [Nostoc sp.]|uniref:hypothetical protein n=1 Tax=Nostoc sp. TaxID=1180 RepID=UPI002FF81482
MTTLADYTPLARLTSIALCLTIFTKIQARFKYFKVHIDDLSVKFWIIGKYSGEGCAKNSFTASMLCLTSIYLLSIAQGILSLDNSLNLINRASHEQKMGCQTNHNKSCIS